MRTIGEKVFIGKPNVVNGIKCGLTFHFNFKIRFILMEMLALSSPKDLLFTRNLKQ